MSAIKTAELIRVNIQLIKKTNKSACQLVGDLQLFAFLYINQ
jgi:hypothetical protein